MNYKPDDVEARGNREITQERYAELVRAENILHALQGGGVDNWSGYGDAMEFLEGGE